MRQLFPIVNWLKTYNKLKFKDDFFAGLTIGVMIVPQGMAYAMLVGLPPIHGLYASTIPLIIYALLGSSRHVSVGPVALVSLLAASGISAMANIGTNEFIMLAILLALIVGLIQILLGVLKLGFLVNFLSHPVMAGFTTAAAIIIAFSQLKHILGLDVSRGKVHEIIHNVYLNAADINGITLLIGATTILLILAIRRFNKQIPSPLIVVFLGAGAVSVFGLHDLGVEIIRDVPSGFPSFEIPALTFSRFQQLLPIAFTIALVSFMESYTVAKAIQRKHNNYEVVANQELIALGASNVGGAFFQSFPISGGFSRTAVNDQLGSKTGVSSIISAGIVILTLLYLTEYFYYLPNAVLGGIIVVAVFSLINVKEAQHLWKKDKLDFSAFIITAISTLIWGVEAGIGVGVVFSIILVMYKASYPHIAELGQVPNSTEYRNNNRFNNLKTYDDILIFRFDAQLFYANAEALKKFVLKKLSICKNINHVILEASVINYLDSSAVYMLYDLNRLLKASDVNFIMTDVKGPVRDILSKNGLQDEHAFIRFELTTKDAVDFIQSNQNANNREYVFESLRNKL
ncbi:MAG TPA: solute carrier 26 family protein [Flavobacteriales bacterium]|nr:solute carrier 26 family protein [Flavobacteriales bacterium]HIN40184.1 solute carrier 26 family protein [Flavobacteriales bacterium]